MERRLRPSLASSASSAFHAVQLGADKSLSFHRSSLMSLMLHAGAKPVTYDELRTVEMPAATESHLPVPHHEIVELARFTLNYFGHEIVQEDHALMPDGQRYFGLMTLRSPYGNYGDVIGLRNSHDKSFPI